MITDDERALVSALRFLLSSAPVGPWREEIDEAGNHSITDAVGQIVASSTPEHPIPPEAATFIVRTRNQLGDLLDILERQDAAATRETGDGTQLPPPNSWSA